MVLFIIPFQYLGGIDGRSNSYNPYTVTSHVTNTDTNRIAGSGSTILNGSNNADLIAFAQQMKGKYGDKFRELYRGSPLQFELKLNANHETVFHFEVPGDKFKIGGEKRALNYDIPINKLKPDEFKTLIDKILYIRTFEEVNGTPDRIFAEELPYQSLGQRISNGVGYKYANLTTGSKNHIYPADIERALPADGSVTAKIKKTMKDPRGWAGVAAAGLVLTGNGDKIGNAIKPITDGVDDVLKGITDLLPGKGGKGKPIGKQLLGAGEYLLDGAKYWGETGLELTKKATKAGISGGIAYEKAKIVYNTASGFLGFGGYTPILGGFNKPVNGIVDDASWLLGGGTRKPVKAEDVQEMSSQANRYSKGGTHRPHAGFTTDAPIGKEIQELYNFNNKSAGNLSKGTNNADPVVLEPEVTRIQPPLVESFDLGTDVPPPDFDSGAPSLPYVSAAPVPSEPIVVSIPTTVNGLERLNVDDTTSDLYAGKIGRRSWEPANATLIGNMIATQPGMINTDGSINPFTVDTGTSWISDAVYDSYGGILHYAKNAATISGSNNPNLTNPLEGYELGTGIQRTLSQEDLVNATIAYNIEIGLIKPEWVDPPVTFGTDANGNSIVTKINASKGGFAPKINHPQNLEIDIPPSNYVLNRFGLVRNPDEAIITITPPTAATSTTGTAFNSDDPLIGNRTSPTAHSESGVSNNSNYDPLYGHNLPDRSSGELSYSTGRDIHHDGSTDTSIAESTHATNNDVASVTGSEDNTQEASQTGYQKLETTHIVDGNALRGKIKGLSFTKLPSLNRERVFIRGLNEGEQRQLLVTDRNKAKIKSENIAHGAREILSVKGKDKRSILNPLGVAERIPLVGGVVSGLPIFGTPKTKIDAQYDTVSGDLQLNTIGPNTSIKVRAKTMDQGSSFAMTQEKGSRKSDMSLTADDVKGGLLGRFDLRYGKHEAKLEDRRTGDERDMHGDTAFKFEIEGKKKGALAGIDSYVAKAEDGPGGQFTEKDKYNWVGNLMHEKVKFEDKSTGINPSEFNVIERELDENGKRYLRKGSSYNIKNASNVNVRTFGESAIHVEHKNRDTDNKTNFDFVGNKGNRYKVEKDGTVQKAQNMVKTAGTNETSDYQTDVYKDNGRYIQHDGKGKKTDDFDKQAEDFYQGGFMESSKGYFVDAARYEIGTAKWSGTENTLRFIDKKDDFSNQKKSLTLWLDFDRWNSEAQKMKMKLGKNASANLTVAEICDAYFKEAKFNKKDGTVTITDKWDNKIILDPKQMQELKISKGTEADAIDHGNKFFTFDILPYMLTKAGYKA